MAYGSKRRSRGWWMAVFLAVGMTALFGYLEKSAIEDWLTPRDDLPESGIVAVLPKAETSIATKGLALGIEEADLGNAIGWLDYRSRPAPSAFAVLEPQAGVRLLAPQAADSSITGSALVARSEANDAHGLLDSPANSRLVSAVKHSDSLPLRHEFSSMHESAVLRDERVSTGFAWPYPKQLIADLDELKEFAQRATDLPVLAWIERLESVLDQLREDRTGESLALLEAMQQFAVETIEQVASATDVTERDTLQLRISHGLIRRVAVWKAVRACLDQSAVSLRDNSFDVAELTAALQQIRRALPATGDQTGWENYLLLSDLENMVNGREEAIAVAAQAAQVVLSRITSINVAETQRQFLDSAEVKALAESLQPLAIAPVDYQGLLVDLETVEQNSEHRSRHTLIDAIQSLRFADDPKQVAVSQALETYYRNANVRVAVSQQFANRMMPAKARIERPVRQTVLGADTRGTSHVDTTLSVRFIPDPHAWNIELDLLGKISSQTHSSRGPSVVFFNSSNSKVSTKRQIRIDPQGIRVDGSTAKVESQDALRGVETAYDGLPFIGEMVKYMASQEFQEKRGPAKRIMQRTIAHQTDTEFDKHLDTKLKQAESGFEQRLLGPLRNLDLNPMVTDLQTTQDRLIARYRIAGDNALAANTPRPQAPSDSLLSIQLHQSAVNNGFSRLGLSDREWTLLELAQNLAHQFGQEPITELSAEVPRDVRVRFAGERPVLVEFIEGRLWLTLNVALLTQPGRIELNDFVIRTSYVPGVAGLEAELIREGAISVDGERLTMRERLPLRAIFAKVFAARSSIPLIQPELLKDPRTQGLAISQIVLEQGWLAVAVSEEASPHVAILKQLQITR